MEYFCKIESYKMVEATVNPFITTVQLFQKLEPKDWLSVPNGANPILNIALGYRWEVQDNILILTGFRTDFNYLKDYQYGDLSEYNTSPDRNFDVYHLTGGGQVTIFGHNIMAGIQYSFGNAKNQTQLYNLSDPVEWNAIEQAPLQGTRDDSMSSAFHGVSLFFGATFNFGQKKKNEK